MLIIDTHCHAGNNWFEPIETLEFEMDRNGVDQAVLIQHGGTYDNTYLLQEAAKRPGRFKVAVLVDPGSRDPLGDLAHGSQRKGPPVCALRRVASSPTLVLTTCGAEPANLAS